MGGGIFRDGTPAPGVRTNTCLRIRLELLAMCLNSSASSINASRA